MLVVDFETRNASLDLREVGAHRYLASAEAVCLVCFDGDRLTLVRPAAEVDVATLAAQLGRPVALADAPPAFHAPLVGHNLHGFDLVLWRRLGYPVPARVVDTMYWCRSLGYPGSLEDAGAALLGRGKDPAGAVAIQALNRGRPLTRGLMTTLALYCARDVLLTYDLYRRLLPEAAGIPVFERRWQRLQAAINERGVGVDRKLAEAIITSEDAARVDAVAAAGVPEEVLRSVKQLRERCAAAGVFVPDCQRDTLLDYIDDPAVPDEVKSLFVARIGISRIARHKAARALRVACDDSRIRGMFRYHGAHTGRESGALVQLQNLPRPAKGVDTADVRRRLLAGERVSGSEAAAACRAMLQGGVVTDYSAIEARVVAWLAGEDDVLDDYRAGRDRYKVMASQLFGTTYEGVTKEQRQFGKTVILACAYGMGPDKFELYAENSGVSLEAAGMSSGEVIQRFRDARPKLAGERTGGMWEGHVIRRGGLWKASEAAVADALRNEVATAGRCTFWSPEAGVIVCRLPSGRDLCYRGVAVEGKDVSWQTRHGRRKLYGGLIVENMTQAVARDLLVCGILACEAAGLRVIMDIHDEVVVDTDDLPAVEKAMLAAPPWAAGLPLAVESFKSEFYRK